MLERTSELSRRAAGTEGQRARKQVLIANVDQVVVVLSAAQPDPVLPMLDRFLVVIEANNLAGRIVVNKIDLADELLVVSQGGYIGESTRREIEYAKRTGKPVRYWEGAFVPRVETPVEGAGTAITKLH